MRAAQAPVIRIVAMYAGALVLLALVAAFFYKVQPGNFWKPQSSWPKAIIDLVADLYDLKKEKPHEEWVIFTALIPLLEMVGDHRFVAAWVPVGRWFKLNVGQRVAIDAGNGKLPGTISRIGTVASALPSASTFSALSWVSPPPIRYQVKAKACGRRFSASRPTP